MTVILSNNERCGAGESWRCPLGFYFYKLNVLGIITDKKFTDFTVYFAIMLMCFMFRGLKDDYDNTLLRKLIKSKI